MPIYEYRCTECQQLIERYCKHIEEDNVQHSCPICRGKTQRLICNTSFALKGGGWYSTEYGSHKGIKEEGSTAASSSSDGGKESGKDGDDKAASGPSSAQ